LLHALSVGARKKGEEIKRIEKETENKRQVKTMIAVYNSRSGGTFHLFAEGVTQMMVFWGSTPCSVMYTF